MNTRAARHLTDDDILRIVAGGPDAADPAEKHAAGCDLCRTRLDDLAGDLARLRRAAAASLPAAPRAIRLPAAEERPAAAAWTPRLGWRLAWTAALVLVVALVTLRSVAPPGPDRMEIAGPTAFREDPVMEEIDRLAENALPEVYREITAGLDRSYDEGFMDFVIPPLDDESVS